MINQSASALNIAEPTPGASGTEEALHQPLRPAFAPLGAANENDDGELDAMRLAAAALAREKAREEAEQRRARERRRWKVLLVFLALLAAGLWYFAPHVVQVLPGAATAYERLGMPVETPGLQVRRLHVRWTHSAEGTPELLVHGMLANQAGRTMAMPHVNLMLLDDAGSVIYRWRIPVNKAQQMAPGAQARFRSRLADVPATAVSVRVQLVPR